MRCICWGLAILVVTGYAVTVEAQGAGADDAPAVAGASSPAGLDEAVRLRIAAYVEAFNRHDAQALGGFWSADGVSVDEETGERTEGRAALVQDFAALFQEHPAARLTGEVHSIRIIREGVAEVEGQTSVFLSADEPIPARFTAILVEEEGDWLVNSSHERNLPTPAAPFDALQELEWLVGTWVDQSEGVNIVTTVRWSPSRAFLIRSFAAQMGDEVGVEGTQIIGWDPLAKQIRCWTFNSDGSFGQGTISRHDGEWMFKMWQILSDGRLAAATKVMTRIDDVTMTIQTIGATVDGAPAPASEAVTVVRTGDAPDLTEAEPATSSEGVAQ